MLLPPRSDLWRSDYGKLVRPCDEVPDNWKPIADEPTMCTGLLSLEMWIRDAIHVDDKNRATLGRE